MDGGMDVLALVKVVCAEGHARSLVRREGLHAVIVVAECLAERVVDVRHLALYGNRIIGIFRVF